MESNSADSNTTLAELQVCYLDYDGVLHDDAVFRHPDRGIYIATPGRTLFEWMPILEGLLQPYPKVSIVLSTSWVRMRDFEFAKRQLSPALQARVIGATFHHREIRKDEFDLMSRCQQILSDVNRRQPQRWFAIDNDNAGWPSHLNDHLVLTKDRLGLSEKAAQEAINEKLKTLSPYPPPPTRCHVRSRSVAARQEGADNGREATCAEPPRSE